MKLRLSLGIGFANACQTDTIEVPDEEVEGLSEEEKEKVFAEYLEDFVTNHLDASWKVVE